MIVNVPGHGQVNFPDGMSEADIGSAIDELTGSKPAGPSPDSMAAHQSGADASLSAHKPQRVPASAAETAMTDFAQGVTAGYGDEIGGAAHALLGSGGTMGERYVQGRDALRAKFAQAHADNPVVGTIAGIGGAAVNPLARARSLPQAIATGAMYGHGNSTAQDSAGRTWDTLTGGAWGAAGKWAGDLVGSVAQQAPDALRKLGTALGYRHLRARGGDIAARVPLDTDSILAAYEAGAFRPGTTVHFAAKKLAAARQQLGAKVGSLEDEMASAGVTGPEREALASEFETLGKARKLTTSAQDPRATAMMDEAKDIRSEIPPPPAAPQASGLLGPNGQPIPAPPAPPPAPSRMSLNQALEKKRSAQWMADKEYDKINAQRSPAGEGKLEVAGRYKRAIDNELNQQGPRLAPDAHAQWAPANRQFGRIADAEAVAQEGSARASGRNWLSWLPLGAAGGAAALGSPQLAATAIGAHLLRTRGGSTGTWAALTADKALRSTAGTAARDALDSDQFRQMMLAAALRGTQP